MRVIFKDIIKNSSGDYNWFELDLDNDNKIALNSYFDDLENLNNEKNTISFSIKAVKNNTNNNNLKNIYRLDNINTLKKYEDLDCYLLDDRRSILNKGVLKLENIDKNNYNFSFSGFLNNIYGRLLISDYKDTTDEKYRLRDWLKYDLVGNNNWNEGKIFLTKDIVYKSFKLADIPYFYDAYEKTRNNTLYRDYNFVDLSDFPLLINNRMELFSTSLIGFMNTRKKKYDKFENKKWITRNLGRFNIDFSNFKTTNDEYFSIDETLLETEYIDNTFGYSDAYVIKDFLVDGEYLNNKNLPWEYKEALMSTTDNELNKSVNETEEKYVYNKWNLKNGKYQYNIYGDKVNIDDDFSESQVGEYRSYYQKPYVYVLNLLFSLIYEDGDTVTISDFEKITGYKFNISKSRAALTKYLKNLVYVLPDFSLDEIIKENGGLSISGGGVLSLNCETNDYGERQNFSLVGTYNNPNTDMNFNNLRYDTNGLPTSKITSYSDFITVDDGDYIKFNTDFNFIINTKEKKSGINFKNYFWCGDNYILCKAYIENENGDKVSQEEKRIAVKPILYNYNSSSGNFFDWENYTTTIDKEINLRETIIKKELEYLGYEIVEIPVYQNSNTGEWEENINIPINISYTFNPLISKRVSVNNNNIRVKYEAFLANSNNPILVYNRSVLFSVGTKMSLSWDLTSSKDIKYSKYNCNRSGKIINLETLFRDIKPFEIIYKSFKLFNLILVPDINENEVSLYNKYDFINNILINNFDLSDKIDFDSIVKKQGEINDFEYKLEQLKEIDELNDINYENYGNIIINNSKNTVKEYVSNINNSLIIEEPQKILGYYNKNGYNNGNVYLDYIFPIPINDTSYNNFYYRRLYEYDNKLDYDSVQKFNSKYRGSKNLREKEIRKELYSCPIITDDYETEIINDIFCWHGDCGKNFIKENQKDFNKAYYYKFNSFGCSGYDTILHPSTLRGASVDIENKKIIPLSPVHYFDNNDKFNLYGNYTSIYDDFVNNKKLCGLPAFSVVNDNSKFMLYFKKPEYKKNEYEDFNNNTIIETTNINKILKMFYTPEDKIECKALLSIDDYRKLKINENSKYITIRIKDVLFYLVKIESFYPDNQETVNCTLTLIRKEAILNPT